MAGVEARAAAHAGGCLCGAVRYVARGRLRPVIACHCEMCRRTSGNFVAASAVRRERLEIADRGALRWYASSSQAQRGFCGVCGGNLFWLPAHGAHISIMAGSLDLPTGLAIAAHIFTADAADYYRICDGAPQFPAGADASVPSVD